MSAPAFELPAQDISAAEADFIIDTSEIRSYQRYRVSRAIFEAMQNNPSQHIPGFEVTHADSSPEVGHIRGVAPGAAGSLERYTVSFIPPGSVSRGLHKAISLIRPGAEWPRPAVQIENVELDMQRFESRLSPKPVRDEQLALFQV
jgi:hypothetical protein